MRTFAVPRAAVILLLSVFLVACGGPAGGPSKPAAPATPATPPQSPQQPGPTPPPSQTQTSTFKDPAGDTFDNNGNKKSGEPYLDIIEVSLYPSGESYRATIKLGAALPSRTPAPGMLLEWDLLIDSDNNPTSGWNWPLIANDIGPDWLIRLELQDAQPRGSVFDIKANKMGTVDFKISSDTITLEFAASLIGRPRTFNYLFAARKYEQAGSASTLVLADKAPNEGHYNIPKGFIYVQPGLPTVSFETPEALVYHNPGNEDKARWYAEALRITRGVVSAKLGAALSQRLTVYVYNTQNDLVQGLQKYSGFGASPARVFSQSGAPRPLKLIMHVSPGFGWHEIADEYTHPVLEEIAGEAYKSAKWLDEGLSSYMAYLTLSGTDQRDAELKWAEASMLAAVQALRQGRLFALSAISTESQWSGKNSADTDIEYAEAFAAARFLADKYGLDKCVNVLKLIKAGDRLDASVQKSFGVSLPQLESDFRAYLEKGNWSKTP